MANYFTAVLGSGSISGLYLAPINKGDSYVYLRVSGIDQQTIKPGERVSAMVAPNSTPLASGTAINLLKQSNLKNNPTLGYFYFAGGTNEGQTVDNLSFSDLKIPEAWENTEFDLYWWHTLGVAEEYGNNLSGVYTYPHNLQADDVILSGYLTADDTIQYSVSIPDGITNDTDANYGSSPTDGPYAVKVEYLNPSDPPVDVPGFSDYFYHQAPSGVNGMKFTLPVYDARVSTDDIPAKYLFKVLSVSAGTDKPGSNPLDIEIDHASLLGSNKYYKNLDTIVFSSAEKQNIKKIGEVEIPANTITRQRLSVGVNDIAVKDNTYVKKGVYVSPYYPLDSEIYTMSLKVKEYIPDYPDLNSYDLIKYYVEFNNNVWERISPLERNDEYEQGVLTPKMFIFDQPSSETVDGNVKYLNYGAVVINFRIKIAFDLSAITEAKFAPPEIYDYKCVIFKKSQFLDL